MDISQCLIQTEKAIREYEKHFPPSLIQDEWVMWLPKESFPRRKAKIKLQKVQSEQDWQEMYRLRVEIEKKFNIFDTELVAGFVEDIKVKARVLNGSWFLAKVNDEVVGEIGIIPFNFDGLRIGRIQDVDIAPKYQGRGLGNELLVGICGTVRKQFDGIGLLASADGWVKNWYERSGFQKVGYFKGGES